MTARITSDQQKQFRRLMEDASDRVFRDFNLDKDGLQRLIERGGEFQDYVVAGIGRFTSKLPDYTLARSILGADFISAEDIAAARGLAYTEEQLIKLGRMLPNQATLEWLRNSSMMLVAGPPSAMTMLDVRDIHAYFFFLDGPKSEEKGAWYDDERETFARTDTVEALTWTAFYKEPVEGSYGLAWPGQQALVVLPLMVPNAAEETWALTTYKAVRKISLLEELFVRTSSVTSDGNRVVLGLFEQPGMLVMYDCDDNHSKPLLGVSACIRF